MAGKAEFRNRDETDVAVLEELTDRSEDGMTVLELRAEVDASIDDIERSLTALKRDRLINIEEPDHPSDEIIIKPADHVTPANDDGTHGSLLQSIREWLPF